MDKNEITQKMSNLSDFFLKVRLVNLESSMQYDLNEDGELVASPMHCFATWKKESRCENCISAKAAACKGTCSKFEFAGDKIYYAMSNYIEVEGQPYAIEMVTELNDDTTIDAFGKEHLIDTITNYNNKMYVDSLTGAYNRRYYDEQLQHLPGHVGLAIVDVDNFKDINDTFGHQAGDEALKAISAAMRSCIRENDAIVRYGGDEFLVLLFEIPSDVLEGKLEGIRNKVSQVCVGACPNHKCSVSIGGIYCDNESEDSLAEADKLLYEAKKTKDAVRVRP